MKEEMPSPGRCSRFAVRAVRPSQSAPLRGAQGGAHSMTQSLHFEGRRDGVRCVR